jgi:RNA polymerase sigma-70 factor (ECF subfamily)
MAEADPDDELVSRWRDGDDQAANAVVERYYDAIWRFFEIKVPRAAADLTQATFASAIEGRRQFRGEGSLRAYFFGIARHHLLHHLRDGSRADRLFSFGDADGASSLTSASRIVARAQEQRLLLRALAELGDEHRMVLQLFYWEGLKNREIAQVLEVPVSTVTSRLMRAREQLRRAIESLPATTAAAREAVTADLEGWTRSLIR